MMSEAIDNGAFCALFKNMWFDDLIMDLKG